MRQVPRRPARARDLLAVLFLVALPLCFFWPVIFGGRTLLPADNLFAWEPWRSLAPQYGITVPHNELLSDLILENYPWKLFIRQCLSAGDIPLWNPYLFSGQPFLAAGQHSALYPFSLIFYVMPLWRAYGLFSALQLALAGIGMYLFVRALGARPGAALLSGITYAFSAFMVVSVAFTMIIAAAAWLPWCLLALELTVRHSLSRLRGGLPWLVAGAIFLGLQALAGHAEITYYTLLIMALLALVRLGQAFSRTRRLPWRPAVLVVAMVMLGIGLGGVQLLPFYELARTNFRSGAAAYRVTYQDVIGWAYPLRQLATFLVPDLYGNPSIHGYVDLVSLHWLPITRNAFGETISDVAWGKGLPSWKNYVEAGSYVGILPLLLALPALASRRLRQHVWPFAALALLSLLFVFGTPLYRLLFLLPGINQLHTPFRWVFPYTLSLAVLAGLGAEAIVGAGAREQQALPPAAPDDRGAVRVAQVVGRVATAAGALALAGLVLVVAWPWPFIGLADRLLAASELTRRAFSDGRMLLSYQYRNLLIFSLALLGSGLAVLALLHPRRRFPLWQLVATAVLVGDLFAIGYGFNPRADPRLLTVQPPVIAFLKQQLAKPDQSPWRFTTLIRPGEKPLNANAGMLFGLEDVRGYDSVIARQYVDYMSLVEPQGELLYNRIAPLTQEQSLGSPLLDLLNVRYVITSQEITRPDYRLVYQGELRVYENLHVLPRAFALTAARRVLPPQLADALKTSDPRQAVLLEGQPQESGVPGTLLPVSILDRQPNEVLLLARLPQPAWVVLTDAYASGWHAYVRPAGSSDTEQAVEIERAYGNFRAVHLPAGEWELRFRYMPRSFQIGLYATFLSAVGLLLIAVAWLWGRFYSRSADDHTVRRVAKNSVTPMALSLINKLIDMAFAMLMLRILAPEGAGRYQFAVTFIGYFEILVRFGLGTLITREVARDQAQGARYLGNSLVVRALLWLASLPVMALVLLAYVLWSGLTQDVLFAVGFFAISVFLGNFADSFSAVFYAHERMETPAFVSTGTTLVKVALGAIVLLVGGGFVGLAAVSVVSNLFTALILGWLLARDYLRPRLAYDGTFAREMVRESFPLMINHLLATVFFQVDVLMLKPLRANGDAEVGYYGAAYRYIRGLDIIPSYLTLALFPVMSRYARSARDSLQRAYHLSLRLLFALSLPIAMGTTFIARQLMLLLAGPDFLPQSQYALQILIWYMPLGFINSVTQYVLIALDEQQYLTKAFLIGVSFNMAANLIGIPYYGYKAAAVVTVLSEVALLIPFMRRVYRHLEPVPWLDLAWRPLLATAIMGLGLEAMRRLGLPVLAQVPLAAVVYGLALLALGFTRSPDMDMVVGLLRRRLAHAAQA